MPRKTIEINANLQCELDGIPLSIESNDGVIVVTVETKEMARKLLFSARRFASLRTAVSHFTDGLDFIAHRLELRVEQTVILAMGHGIKSGFLRIAGYKNTKLWPLRLL